jgi:hypothetical protein
MKIKNKPVTRFMDMHSGGHLKTPYTHIYIDEPIGEAIRTFKELFKHDPDNVTCKCCGEDFIYEEYSSLEEATAYDRDCKWTGKKYDLKDAPISVEEYFSGKNKVIFITE